MSMTFKQKYGEWALITGGTSGIGAEMASQLAQKGLNILLVARQEKALIEHSEKLKKLYGIEASYIAADLATPEGVKKVTNVKQEIGLLVLAAGLEVNGAFEKNSFERELQVIQLNVTSTYQLARHFSQPMVERGCGGILMVSSLVAHMVAPYFSNYAGSKAYVLQMGASLYGELKPKGVDVTVLSPGLTNTPMSDGANVEWNKLPMARKEPSEVAELAIAGLGKRFLTIPGFRNKLVAWMANLTPLGMQAVVDQIMIKRAIHKDNL